MGHELPLSCGCGQVRGVLRDVEPSSSNRVVCYCRDCQTFAHHLDAQDRVLDAHGGTDVSPVPPHAVEITEGWDQIRAVRQSPKGAMRVYAGCCNTPMANCAPQPHIPFVGLIHAFVDHDTHGMARDETLGPVRAYISVASARGDADHLASKGGVPFRLMSRLAPRIAWWRVSGRWKDNPFFEGKRPRVEPELMTRERRKALQDALPG